MEVALFERTGVAAHSASQKSTPFSSCHSQEEDLNLFKTPLMYIETAERDSEADLTHTTFTEINVKDMSEVLTEPAHSEVRKFSTIWQKLFPNSYNPFSVNRGEEEGDCGNI